MATATQEKQDGRRTRCREVSKKELAAVAVFLRQAAENYESLVKSMDEARVSKFRIDGAGMPSQAKTLLTRFNIKANAELQFIKNN